MEYTVTLRPDQEKAMLTDMISIQEWLNNAAQNKARQCGDIVCKQALNDPSDTILTLEEKKEIGSALSAEGRIITTIDQISSKIRRQIILKARVKSAAEKTAEAEER